MPSGREGPSFIELARRRQIVDAAIETIAELGLPKASIAAIAARAKVSPALISYHFGSRQGLIDEMRVTTQRRVDKAMESSMEDESYPMALRGMLRRFAAHCLDNLPAMLVLTQLERHDDVGGQARQAERAKGLDELSAFIAEGQLHGQFRPADARLLAAVLINAMTDLPHEIRGRPDADRSVFEREWPSLFVNSIAVRYDKDKNHDDE